MLNKCIEYRRKLYYYAIGQVSDSELNDFIGSLPRNLMDCLQQLADQKNDDVSVPTNDKPFDVFSRNINLFNFLNTYEILSGIESVDFHDLFLAEVVKGMPYRTQESFQLAIEMHKNSALRFRATTRQKSSQLYNAVFQKQCFEDISSCTSCWIHEVCKVND